ncbi:MAG: ABC transporter ATP-binding protein [Anaerolineae bacterium]|jgi:putative ABC transport system ATP-binding protein
MDSYLRETLTLHAKFAIRAVNLTRTFEVGETTVEALRGASLEVPHGQFVALVGPSGSGKSTFLNLVGGLDRPTSGELWVDSVELSASKEKALTEHRRTRVGFVFQSFNLLPRLTALENVALPLMFTGVSERERLARARELLGQVGLAERLAHRPTQLSGGEQQRVAIARALIGRPAIILADEPTGNVDSVTGSEIMALLRGLNRDQGVTLLLVTHDAEAASFAERIVQLRDGCIVEAEGRS